MMKVAHAPASCDGFIQYGAAGHLLDILTKVADREPLRRADFTVIGSLFAHNHAKERRLPGAVRAYEAHLLTGIQLERRVNEDELTAVLFVDVGKRNHSGYFYCADFAFRFGADRFDRAID